MKKAYGTYEIAEVCNVSPPTVGRWIDEGKLPFFTTGGGHRRVWAFDLLAFLKKHNIPSPPDLAGDGLRILIVDDEQDSLDLMTDIVRQSFPEAEIDTARDGFEAGRKTTLLQPRLIILDLNLPGLDGFDVCRRIRQDPVLKGTRILAVTGYDVESSKDRALDAGADGFLGKPFDAARMADALSALLRSDSRRGHPIP